MMPRSGPRPRRTDLGAAERIERLVLHWPMSKTTQILEDVAVERTARVIEGADALQVLARPAFVLGEG